MTIQEQLRAATHWAVAGNHCGLKQQDAMIAAADRIDALEAALRTLADWKAPAGRRTEYGQGFDEAREQVALIAREALEASS